MALRTRTMRTPHQSNLGNILQQFPHMTESRVEKIETFIRPPCWTPKAKIKMEGTEDNAKNLHDKIEEHSNTATTKIYTDCSAIEQRVGGAASFNSTTNEVSHQDLGSERHFNVYAAELSFRI